MTHTNIPMFMAACLIPLVGSCGTRDQQGQSPARQSASSIVGKWQEVGGDRSRWEFITGGHFTGTGRGQQFAGTYEFIEAGRLKVDFGGRGAMIFQVSLTDDTLRLTPPNGNTSKLRRIP